MTLVEKTFRVLFVAGERGVTVREIIDEIYADDSEGGALNARNCVHQFIYTLKRRLAPYGATIKSETGTGASRHARFRGAIYRLETPRRAA